MSSTRFIRNILSNVFWKRPTPTTRQSPLHFSKITACQITCERFEYLIQNYFCLMKNVFQVEDRLNEERDRCQIYLDHSTLDALLKTCDEALIAQHLERYCPSKWERGEEGLELRLARYFMKSIFPPSPNDWIEC